MNKKTLWAAGLCFFALWGIVHAEQPKVLTNHLGYEKDGAKRAVVLGHAGDEVSTFKVLEYPGGKEVLAGQAVNAGPVAQWKDWVFWTADLTPLKTEGFYVLECATGGGPVRSFPFEVRQNILERQTLYNVVAYFKSERCSGLLDKADRNLQFAGDTSASRVDVHGGWYDATGDYGKHLSHLSYSTYFNPQQIPMSVWSLFKSYQQLEDGNDPDFRQYKRRLLDEAMFGADYLVRVKNPTGSFYRSVGAPGGEKKAEDRRIGKEGEGFAIKTLATKNGSPNEELKAIAAKFPYEVGYRNGGGVAIAALAIASTYDVSGDFASADYLKAARDAFAFLERNNLLYANDGRENIVDDYCALLAATELFKATKDPQYKTAADQRAKNLVGRLMTGGQDHYWRADDADRPFFHAADACLPVVSLLNYLDVADDAARKQVLDAVRTSLEYELKITDEVPNPFGYARQRVQSKDGSRRTTFFFPHDTETAPWWQGENARLGSMAAAARLAAKHFTSDPAFHDRLEAYATNQLNWILGLNPYDACMLHGSGRNNPPYMFFTSYEYTNAPGGIVNGITSGYSNPEDIDFNLFYSVTGKDEDWRWGEQWLPHAAWYLYAVALGD